MKNDLQLPADDGDESFELLKLLGSGGFAHTYLVKVLDEELVREFGSSEVALKIPLSKQKARALRRELEIHAVLHMRLKGVQSRNIVRYLGFDFFRGFPVMALEYVAQGSLRKVMGNIGSQKRLPVNEAVRITSEILNGLMIIHDEHIFHRDIKPDNILMDGQTPKIADLGISRLLASNEMASTTTGTIYYMSPEILSEDGASFPSDIWSMGVMLYEMTTGMLPFGNKDTPIAKMVNLIQNGDHIPACEVCRDVPKDLSKVIDLALKKEVSKRFASAREMHEGICRLGKVTDDLEKEMAAIRDVMECADQSKRVEAKLRELAEKYPRDSRVWQYWGEFYNRCQCYQEALEAFSKGLKLAPDNALLHWDYGFTAQKIGKRAEAVQHLEKALSLDLDPSMKRFAITLLKSLKGGRD